MSQTVTISPTVGRIVWFYPRLGDPFLGRFSPPFAAQIAYVHNDERVNLMVVNPDGTTRPEEGVLLVQDDQVAPHDEAFCTWMPYQKGQAARLEAEQARDALREPWPG